MATRRVVTTVRCADARATVGFLTCALGFELLPPGLPDEGAVGHAELKAGGDLLMLSDDPDPGDAGKLHVAQGPAWVYLVVDDPAAAHAAALAAGAEEVQPVTDHGYGTMGTVRFDRHLWTVGDYAGAG